MAKEELYIYIYGEVRAGFVERERLSIDCKKEEKFVESEKK